MPLFLRLLLENVAKADVKILIVTRHFATFTKNLLIINHNKFQHEIQLQRLSLQKSIPEDYYLIESNLYTLPTCRYSLNKKTNKKYTINQNYTMGSRIKGRKVNNYFFCQLLKRWVFPCLVKLTNVHLLQYLT